MTLVTFLIDDVRKWRAYCGAFLTVRPDSSFKPPVSARAFAVTDVAKNAATEPLLIQCSGPDGESFEVFAKSSWELCPPRGLAAEVICGWLAQFVGLKAPGMVFVEISEAFLQESLAPLYPQHGRRVVSSIKPLFGSVNLGRGLVDASSGLVSESDFFEQCVSVFVFDAVVGNYDRRRGKPNSMVRDGDLFILDHEKALDFSLRSAFAPSLLDANWQPGEHLFSGIIGNAQAGDLAAECVEKYTCVTDELLQLWSDSIPQTWGVESFSREALNFLAELRSNTAVAIENLRRVLQ